MTVSCLFDPDSNLVHIKYVGRGSSRDLVNVSRSLRVHPDFRPDANVLIDMRRVADLEFKSSDLLGHAVALQAEKRKLSKPIRQAILLRADDQDTQELVRTYLGYTGIVENLEIEVFVAWSDAVAWLGTDHGVDEVPDEADWIELVEPLEA